MHCVVRYIYIWFASSWLPFYTWFILLKNIIIQFCQLRMYILQSWVANASFRYVITIPLFHVVNYLDLFTITINQKRG